LEDKQSEEKMVGDMRTFFYTGLFRGIPSIAAVGLYILCLFPQHAICLLIGESESNGFMSDLVSHISDGSPDRLIQKFDELEGMIQSSGDSLSESRKFLQSFIEEINIRHGLNLMIHEACVLVLANLHAMQLPTETQNLLLETIAFIEADFRPTIEWVQRLNINSLNIIRPWFWLHKKTHKSLNQNQVEPYIVSPLLQVVGTDNELPGSVYVGGMEVLAGALVFTLGLAFPPAYGVGSALMIDGTRRVLNGLEEIDRQHPFDPDQPSGSGLFNIDF
jgi:hypothetical protein